MLTASRQMPRRHILTEQSRRHGCDSPVCFSGNKKKRYQNSYGDWSVALQFVALQFCLAVRLRLYGSHEKTTSYAWLYTVSSFFFSLKAKNIPIITKFTKAYRSIISVERLTRTNTWPGHQGARERLMKVVCHAARRMVSSPPPGGPVPPGLACVSCHPPRSRDAVVHAFDKIMRIGYNFFIVTQPDWFFLSLLKRLGFPVPS